MQFHAAHALHVQPTILAVLPDRADYDALSLAIETTSQDADIALFPDGKSAVRHLRQCSRSAVAPTRRWPDVIVLDVDLISAKPAAWLKELILDIQGSHIFTPLLALADPAQAHVRDWPREPDEVVLKFHNGHEYVRALGQSLKYWLRRTEIERLGNRPDATFAKSTA